MRIWIYSIRDWSLHWADTKWASLALFICAFADASFVPLPTPLLFLTMTLLNASKAYRYALIGTLGILIGGMAGYALGHFAWVDVHGNFTAVAQFMFNHFPGFSREGYEAIRIQFEEWGFGILFIASFLPVPYNTFSIMSGIFDVNVLIFCLATLIGQGVRFYLMALLIVKLGPGVKKVLTGKLKPIAIIATAVIVAAIIVIRVF
jgi:membrane protein YqaA with SNARE-associated domain